MPSATETRAAGPADSAHVAERCRASIYRYILRLVHDPEGADDLTQETFLRVHQRLDELRDPAALVAFVTIMLGFLLQRPTLVTLVWR